MPLRIFMSDREKRERDSEKNTSKEDRIEVRNSAARDEFVIFGRKPSKEERIEAQLREHKRKKEEAFRSTPKGIARTAKEDGRKVFQYVEKLSETVGAAVPMVGAFTSGQQNEGIIISSIEDIESEGWTLINDNYVFQVTGSVSRDKFLSSGQQEAVSGQLIGIYTFRAVDE